MLRQTYYENEVRVQEKKSINLQEYFEIEYWSKKLGITPELLRRAVNEAGSNEAEVVEKFIRSKYSF